MDVAQMPFQRIGTLETLLTDVATVLSRNQTFVNFPYVFLQSRRSLRCKIAPTHLRRTSRWINIRLFWSCKRVNYNKEQYLTAIPQSVIMNFNVSIQIGLTFSTVTAFWLGACKRAQFTVTIIDVTGKWMRAGKTALLSFIISRTVGADQIRTVVSHVFSKKTFGG